LKGNGQFWGVNLGCPIVTKGKFDAQWCGSVYTDEVVACGGE